VGVSVSELVVAEGVALELRPARLASRTVAALLDGALMALLFLICYRVISALLSAASADTVRGLKIGTLVLVGVGYPLASEVVGSGRSIGKLAAGLRVVRLDGGPERFRHALVRALGLLFADLGLPIDLTNQLVVGLPLIVLVGLPGAIAVACSRQGRRLGDLLAGTIVVRERTEAGVGMLPMPPNPQLAQWAAAARVQDAPPGLVLAARQLISRTFELDHAAAADLAEQLARQVAAYVTPAPPPGIPPFQYLVAVTAERYRRELTVSTGRTPAYTDPRPGPRDRRPGARSAWSA
jgi:uncharacterized RDD family membrane protein YckC